MEKLKQYDAMQQSIRSIPEEVKRLEEVATRMASPRMDKTPTKGGGKYEDALLDNILKRRELQWSLQQTKRWVKSVDIALSTLTPEEKLVLHRLYISPFKGAVDRLCEELGVEKTSVYRKRDGALYRFTLALYGVQGG